MSELTTNRAVKGMKVENGSAPCMLQLRQPPTDTTINKKMGNRGSQMSAKYEYGDGMSVPQERQLFLPLLMDEEKQWASSNKQVFHLHSLFGSSNSIDFFVSNSRRVKLEKVTHLDKLITGSFTLNIDRSSDHGALFD